MPSLLMRLFAVVAVSISLVHAADKSRFPAASVSVAGNKTVAVSAAGQGRRIALVIGNGDYQYPNSLPKLDNPPHDAEDIAEALRRFGFEVVVRKNLTLEGMNRAVAEFGSKIGGSEAALFYFAGHGIQVKNQNYLMPVGARVESEAAVPFQGFNVNQILEEMDNGKSGANIVMLDACRNNPIGGKFRSGASRGLASPGITPQGTVIVYATDPGNTAADGEGRNGLFSAGLLMAFKGRDLSLDGVLTAASEYVEKKSVESDPTRKQTPYVNGPKTLQKNFHFRVTVDPGHGEIERIFWASIERSTDAADFEAYLDKYPKGSYRALAENRLRQLKAGQQAASAPVAAAPGRYEDPETQFWNEVKDSGTREYLDAYLRQYPAGKYLALAQIGLNKLDERDAAQRIREAAEKQQAAEAGKQEALRAEQDVWDEAKSGSSAAAYTRYLERYPNGRYAALAQIAGQKAQREEAAMPPGKVFRDCADCPEMIVLPAGSFTMGSLPSESGRSDDEGPQHRVSVRSFAAGRFEITRGQFAAFVKESSHAAGDECYTFEGGKSEKRSGRDWQNPGYTQDDTHPVVCVNWDDAREYVAWLARKTGKNYRLLSEAEWEYAARAGSSTARYWGERPDQACIYASVMDGTGKRQVAGMPWVAHDCMDGHAYTAPAGSFKPNAFGLYDMIGNAWEWTEDCWSKSYRGAPGDGSAWVTGDCSVGRVLRGGSWTTEPLSARSASRLKGGTSGRASSIGFRLARTLP